MDLCSILAVYRHLHSCLIDDATRYILHGEFYGTMEQGIVEDTLQKAMLKFGLPRRLYFDNGTQYRTRWMKRACDLLGIRLIYAKPEIHRAKANRSDLTKRWMLF